MGNTEFANAAIAMSLLAADPALEIRERAVTQADVWRELCPTTGEAGLQLSQQDSQDPSALTAPMGGALRPIGIASRYGTDFSSTGIDATGITATGINAVSIKNDVRLVKPRYGYRATRSTG